MGHTDGDRAAALCQYLSEDALAAQFDEFRPPPQRPVPIRGGSSSHPAVRAPARRPRRRRTDRRLGCTSSSVPGLGRGRCGRARGRPAERRPTAPAPRELWLGRGHVWAAPEHRSCVRLCLSAVLPASVAPELLPPRVGRCTLPMWPRVESGCASEPSAGDATCAVIPNWFSNDRGRDGPVGRSSTHGGTRGSGRGNCVPDAELGTQRMPGLDIALARRPPEIRTRPDPSPPRTTRQWSRG